MSKKKPLIPAITPPADKPAAAPQSHFPSPSAVREAVESVVIAFVLAFLFRTFEAEAFVIPTGSMAPTLMGRHKDLHCPKCGSPYQLSASNEVTQEGALIVDQFGKPLRPVTAGTCPMCRYTAELPADKGEKTDDFPKHQPSYNGDRILVSKFAYQFRDPKRWEVIVFKFPGDSQSDSRTNFIKRLVGLPGETIRIQHGDIWVRNDARGEKDFHIARKTPDKLAAMLQPVFDNDYMPAIAKQGWPQRWRPMPPDGWQSESGTTFRADGKLPGENWLRYEHRVPSYWQWPEKAGNLVPELQPRLISDFIAYDTNRDKNDGPAPPDHGLGMHWVGDLAIDCTLDVLGDKGDVILELRKGGRRFQCRLDLSTGRATLSISGNDQLQFMPTATTAVRGPGRHNIRFANCDHQLLLWIDGQAVSFDASTSYDELMQNHAPQESDLQPAGIASVGAAVEVSRLKILRDIYYLAVKGTGQFQESFDVQNYLDNHGQPQSREPIHDQRHVDFTLKDDQFFALGDNSVQSKDGRLWGHDNHFVPRELLIGKALFIYWPHSWNRTPGVNIPFPYFPNFSRMQLVK